MKTEYPAQPETSAARSKRAWVAWQATPERRYRESSTRRGGAAQDLHGQTADAARNTAATIDKWLRRTIETQPRTVAIVARLGSAGCSAECTGRSDRWPWLQGLHKAALAFEREQRRRENQRRKEEVVRARERKRRAQVVAKAQAALEKGKREHDSRASSIEAERAALEKRLQAEDARWGNRKRSWRAHCAKQANRARRAGPRRSLSAFG
jgi:hypothetical protein